MTEPGLTLPSGFQEPWPAWSTAQCLTLACLLECTIPKPGNVHRGADFAELTFMDFVVSAVAVGEILARAAEEGVGRTAWKAVTATQCATGTNTNLGTVLLLAPLAAVPRERPLEQGVRDVLAALTAEDARYVYRAIRQSGSGALGRVDRWDIHDEPPHDLLEAMRLAADRDLVARQYVTDYALIFCQALPWLLEGIKRGWSLTDSVIHVFLRLLATNPDSLIARKCGPSVAADVSVRAAAVLAAGEPGETQYYERVADLDFYLRQDGHRRNPGTTADLIAATLFVALRDRHLKPPWR
jgi:triphosphoribosyl-dephospho-CoA synthase